MQKKMEVVGEQQKHFVLVHGACHGAWSWYKVKSRLESAGHRVTALDLSASGVNPKILNEVTTLSHYTQPLLELMESIPSKERVILVGHSLGGLNLALAMDKFPQKIAASVFIAAFMPDSTHHPSYVLDQYSVSIPSDNWVDTKFGTYGDPNDPLTSMFFGPEFLSLKLYQLSSTEDLALAKLLVRPSSLFMEDLAKANNFTNEGYGSVTRVYVVCNEDKAIPEKLQLWMIENNPVKEVRQIKDADHMPMFSKPDKLCSFLLEIAHKYT